MILHTNKQVTRTMKGDSGTYTYSVDNASLVDVKDNGDGTVTLTSLSTPGVANLTTTGTHDDGTSFTHVEAINVLPDGQDAPTFKDSKEEAAA